MKQESKTYKYLRNVGISLFVSSVVLLIISLILRIESIQNWYDQFADILYSFELAVLSIDNNFLVVLTIIFIFALKSILPIIPFSAICLVTGIILPPQLSIIVNLAGASVWLMIKYLWGFTLGPGYLSKILNRYKKIKDVLQSKGNGNPLLLFAFRVIPFFPHNTVSQLYGSMQFNPRKYLLISLLGLLPRIVAYAFVGESLFDPFSFSFYMPIILLLAFTGVATLILSLALKKASEILP